MILYIVKNCVNKKIYIGKTIQKLSDRWHRHTYHARKGDETPLCRAIRKYGASYFTIEPILEDFTDDKELMDWEVKAIAIFQSRNPEIGYNVTVGGQGASGQVWTEERRKRASDSKRGNRNPQFGKPSSQKQKEAVRTRMRNNHPMKGRKQSAEALEKMSAASKARCNSPEYMEKLREAARKGAEARWGNKRCLV